MLCPKCGFISFDHLSVCGKCRNDLSGIGMDLHGTAVDVECRLFLGGALKEASVPQDDQPESDGAAVAVGFPFEQEEGLSAADELEARAQDDAEQAEAVEEVSVDDEEPSALEFELDEIVLVDSPSASSAMADEKVAEEVQFEEAEMTLLDFGDDEAGEEETVALSEGEPEIDSAALVIDTSKLTLDSFEEENGQAVSSEEAGQDEQSGQLTIDLNAIDLSDLVHGQNGSAPVSEKAASPSEESGLDFEGAMDLSLFVGEPHEALLVDSEQSFQENGPAPIDLSLVDEALIDLAVDPGRQGQAPPEESHSDILELSMEDSNK